MLTLANRTSNENVLQIFKFKIKSVVIIHGDMVVLFCYIPCISQLIIVLFYPRKL